MKKHLIIIIFGLLVMELPAQDLWKNPNSNVEGEYYKITTLPIPDDIVLEVGGLTLTDNDQLAVSTRRGEVWLIDQPYSPTPSFSLFARGLHEPLGLAFRNDNLYLSQRGELTKLKDRNNDGKADLFETIYEWPLSGNYHEYSYGPKFDLNGDMLVTLNLAWIGYGESLSKWRGWLLRITEDGEMEPIATGLRSPAGYGVNNTGDIFYAENQGDWVGSGRITHLEKGDFAGNVAGLNWSNEMTSPLTLQRDDIQEFSGLSLYQYAKLIPEIKAPAVWFPHTLMGISTSDIVFDETGGAFGPFEGQMFVGDQGHSTVMRVFLEKINGVYQGACFPFREGFNSGILRMIWGKDGSMFVGMTSRGWSSTGPKMYGLQRLEWTGEMPFEIKEMRVRNDGFDLEFTKLVDKATAEQLSSYAFNTFTYKYQRSYGSPITDAQPGMVHQAKVLEDGKTVRLTLHGMRKGYIHSIIAEGIQDIDGNSLLHSDAYYTLNEVPGGSLKMAGTPGLLAFEEDAVVQAKRMNKMPETWVEGPDVTLSLGTKPGLQYDITELKVKAGAKVEVVFNNNDDMLHNLVFVKPGDAVDKVGKMAEELGLDGGKLNYVPNSDLVLFHTGILQPETEEKIYFEAPKEKGIYRYVCTFPGHSYVMRGTLIVE
ncbi:MAG: auracyanin family protein [Cyclobacteriaceae bacterium]